MIDRAEGLQIMNIRPLYFPLSTFRYQPLVLAIRDVVTECKILKQD